MKTREFTTRCARTGGWKVVRDARRSYIWGTPYARAVPQRPWRDRASVLFWPLLLLPQRACTGAIAHLREGSTHTHASPPRGCSFHWWRPCPERNAADNTSRASSPPLIGPSGPPSAGAARGERGKESDARAVDRCGRRIRATATRSLILFSFLAAAVGAVDIFASARWSWRRELHGGPAGGEIGSGHPPRRAAGAGMGRRYFKISRAWHPRRDRIMATGRGSPALTAARQPESISSCASCLLPIESTGRRDKCLV